MSFPGDPWVTAPLTCSEAIAGSVDEAAIVDVVSELLYVLSGRQFGVHTQTVRPRVLSSSCPTRRRGGFPEGGGPCGGLCGGSSRSLDDLGQPIIEVDEVMVDGVVLAEADYEVRPSRIVRVDGGWFPCCQDPDLPDDAAGSVRVEYSWGVAIPDSGVLAAHEFACQLALAAAPATAGKCKLPARVQTITRQNVTMTLLDPQAFLDDGRTGLYLVDLFLSAFNPGKNRRRARVYSPDLPYTHS